MGIIFNHQPFNHAGAVMKKKLFLSLLVMFQVVHPIQKSTALVCTGITGITALIGSFWAFKKVAFPAPFISSGVTSGVASLAAYHIFMAHTPRGRFNRARKIVERLSKKAAIDLPFNKEELFLQTLQSIYIADELWLISAHNDLVSMHKELQHALTLLAKCREEIVQDYMLLQQCANLVHRTREMIANVSKGITTIRNSKEYIAQYKLYQQMLISEKQLLIERARLEADERKASAYERMAYAQERRGYRDRF